MKSSKQINKNINKLDNNLSNLTPATFLSKFDKATRLLLKREYLDAMKVRDMHFKVGRDKK